MQESGSAGKALAGKAVAGEHFQRELLPVEYEDLQVIGTPYFRH